MDIAVFGSGGWGAALARLLDSNGHRVTLWSHRESTTELLRKTHESPKLPGVALDMEFSSDPACAGGKGLVVMAVPSFAVRETAELIRPFLDENALLVSASKGIESGSCMRMSEIIESVTGRSCAVLSGPSHAEEVGRGAPTGCVAASPVREHAELVQDVFMSPAFRVYANPDIIGVELGGALKNVIALCTGICDGMGFGDNTKALLMTRGLTETARLGVALGGKKESFAGLSGVGDLIVTCTSMHSRNRRAGMLIGQGMSPEKAAKEVGAVVEGYYAAVSAKELAGRAGVEMPLTEAAYSVLCEGRDAREVVGELMGRARKHEIESSWI